MKEYLFNEDIFQDIRDLIIKPIKTIIDLVMNSRNSTTFCRTIIFVKIVVL